MSNTVTTWEFRFYFGLLNSFPLCIYPEVGLLDHTVILFSMFLKDLLFSIMAIKPDTERQILYNLTYMLNLKELNSTSSEQNGDCQGGLGRQEK